MTELSRLFHHSNRNIRLSGSLTLPSSRVISLSPKDFISFHLTQGVPDGNLLGACLSSHVRCVLKNENGEFLLHGDKRGAALLNGALLHVNIEIADENGKFLSCPVGNFYISSSELWENDVRCILEGTDQMAFRLDLPFFDNNTYPVTFKTLISSMLRQAGETAVFSSDLEDVTLYEKPDFGSLSVRRALSCACEALGCFACVDASGEILIQPVQKREDAHLLSPHNILKRGYSDTVFGPVHGLKVHYFKAPHSAQDRSGFFSDETPVREFLEIGENPFFPYQGQDTKRLCENLLKKLSGLTLCACQVVWQGDPSVSIGRKAEIRDKRGGVTLTSITHRVLRFDREFSMEISCTVSPLQEKGPGRIFTSRGDLNASSLSGELSGSMIVPGSLSVSSLSSHSITGEYIAAKAIDAEHLSSSSVTADKIVSGSVTADKLAALSVTAEKLHGDSVTADKIKAGEIQSRHLASSSITADKISSGAVHASHIAAGSITAGQLKAGLISADSGLISMGAIGTAHIQDASVTDGKIVGLTADKITAGTLDASIVQVTNLKADNITTGTLNGKVIPVLGSEKLSSGAVTGEKIADHSVTADKIVSGSVTADKLAAGSVTTEKILSGSVTADKLSALSVTADKLAAGSVTASKLSSDVENSLNLESNQSIRAVISNVKIGGANLLAAPLNQKFTFAPGGNYAYLFLLEKGETYTFSVGTIRRLAGNAPRAQMTVYRKSDGFTAFSQYLDVEKQERQSFTFRTPGDAEDYFILLFNGCYGETAANQLSYEHIKIEKGEKATDWTPSYLDPAPGVENAAATLTEKEFSIGFSGKTAFSVTPGETRVDSDVLTASRVEGNVVNTQPGKVIEVDENTSIQSSLNNLKKYLEEDVTLRISGYHGESVTGEGFEGMGRLIFHFTQNGVLKGRLHLKNCSCPVLITGDHLKNRCLSGEMGKTVWISHCSFVRFFNVAIEGAPRTSLSSGSDGIFLEEESFVTVEECLIERCGACVKIGDGLCHIKDVQGGVWEGDYTTAANQAFAVLLPGKAARILVSDGRVPVSGQLFSSLDGLVTAREEKLSPSPSPDIQPPYRVKTLVWQAVKGFCTYKKDPSSHGTQNTWVEDGPCQGRLRRDDVWGYSPSYGYGLWILENADTISKTLSGKKIRTASVRIKRTPSYGSTTKQGACRLYGHGFSAVPERADPLSQLYDVRSAASPLNGEEACFPLDQQAFLSLQSGTLKGFGLSSFYDPAYGDYPFMRFEKNICELRVVYEE